mmetsp:Transcript_56100/g.135677  ORF Transcript_56100/g.135677 Transcript_56100/m.135677 type:complete len:365 (-) Transcript_56100:1595-2689(-)
MRPGSPLQCPPLRTSVLATPQPTILSTRLANFRPIFLPLLRWRRRNSRFPSSLRSLPALLRCTRLTMRTARRLHIPPLQTSVFVVFHPSFFTRVTVSFLPRRCPLRRRSSWTFLLPILPTSLRALRLVIFFTVLRAKSLIFRVHFPRPLRFRLPPPLPRLRTRLLRLVLLRRTRSFLVLYLPIRCTKRLASALPSTLPCRFESRAQSVPPMRLRRRLTRLLLTFNRRTLRLLRYLQFGGRRNSAFTGCRPRVRTSRMAREAPKGWCWRAMSCRNIFLPMVASRRFTRLLPLRSFLTIHTFRCLQVPPLRTSSRALLRPILRTMKRAIGLPIRFPRIFLSWFTLDLPKAIVSNFSRLEPILRTNR